MVIVYWVLLTIAGTVALFYRSRAKYFESLFELSKGYGVEVDTSGIEHASPRPSAKPTDEQLRDSANDSYAKIIAMHKGRKLNKDGSIAKKRGRKSKNEVV